jgi:hypothetical protein
MASDKKSSTNYASPWGDKTSFLCKKIHKLGGAWLEERRQDMDG